jgi:RIO kinase 2
MKLDPTVLRTMDAQDFKVLEAVEKGMQRHQLVPAPLIASLSNLRHGGTSKVISGLLRDKLLSHDKSCGYDGYRVTSAGYDILALQNLKARKIIAAFGDRIGTGKESDIYLAVHPNGQQVVLKIHRLGRTSFRNVKKTRDYFVYTNKKGEVANNQANSWLFLSRKSAMKEYAFMKALYNANYRTPEPLAHNRHIVCMSLVRGVPLYQITSNKLSSDQAASIFEQASDLALRLAKHGLVHCDLNEFNLLVDMSGIQQTALHGEHDPYVRHSGLSVAASTPGTLSGRGAWETAYSQPEQQEEIVEAPPEPTLLLDNGEPKPVVTLIDFPQMVSTQHPNAKELYERDMGCLYRFFTHKLHCRIPEEDEAKLLLQWEDVVEELAKLPQPSADGAAPPAEVDDTESVCLASNAQLRLDQELKASGYSQADSSRDSELYYYYNSEKNEENAETGEIKEEEQGDVENENDNENDEQEEEKESDHVVNDDGDDDDDSIESIEDNVTITSTMMAAGQFADMTRQQLQEQARLRVRQHLETQKKKGRQQGAFRKQNSNKSYLKGKRVFNDVVL